MFRHPSYYKKLRERNKSDRVISERQATASSMRAPGLGQKRQASSSKRQASGLTDGPGQYRMHLERNNYGQKNNNRMVNCCDLE